MRNYLCSLTLATRHVCNRGRTLDRAHCSIMLSDLKQCQQRFTHLRNRAASARSADQAGALGSHRAHRLGEIDPSAADVARRWIAGHGRVTILQPRRLATRLLAGWVAQSANAELGGEVGYQMRLDNVYVARHADLLRHRRRAPAPDARDPQLEAASARIVFDEFHERHLYGDITLARALQIQESTRPDLIIIVMSATLDAGAVEKYLQPCAVLSSQGRTYPVEIEYLAKPAGDAPGLGTRRRKNCSAWCASILKATRSSSCPAVRDQPHRAGGPGRARREFVVLPLHGELPRGSGRRGGPVRPGAKSIVATNVAETSLTIDGVRVVIDSGLARIRALRSVSRHQHAAHRKNQPRLGRSTRRPRGSHRAGPLPAALDGARAQRRARRRNYRK